MQLKCVEHFVLLKMFSTKYLAKDVQHKIFRFELKLGSSVTNGATTFIYEKSPPVVQYSTLHYNSQCSGERNLAN